MDFADRRLHSEPNGQVEGAVALLQQKVVHVLCLSGQGVVEFARLNEVCVFEERQNILNRRICRPGSEAARQQAIVTDSGRRSARIKMS